MSTVYDLGGYSVFREMKMQIFINFVSLFRQVTELLLLNVLPGITASGLTADLSKFEGNPFDDLAEMFHADLRDDLSKIKESHDEPDVIVSPLPLKDYLEQPIETETPLSLEVADDQNELFERYLAELTMAPLAPLPSLEELCKWS
jgi:hypothetical protein